VEFTPPMREATRQIPETSGRQQMETGEARQVVCLDEAKRPRRTMNETGPGLLTAVLARENLLRAMKRVRVNGGAAGVDGLDIDQTATLLKTRWPVIRDSLLKGTYRPQPVRRVMIPKPGGGERELGVPTAKLCVLATVVGHRCRRQSRGLPNGYSGWHASGRNDPRGRANPTIVSPAAKLAT
jgi:hypothetical protein